MTITGQHPDNGLDIFDDNGIPRVLGCLPPSDDQLKMRAGIMGYKQYLESEGQSLIPRSNWKVINRRSTWGTKFQNNQQQCSGCTGFSGAQGFSKVRVIRGHKFQLLSGAWLYSLINGNRDAGSVITDAVAALTAQGDCLQSDMDYPHIFASQQTAQAKQNAPRFKVELAFICTTFDEMGDGIQRGGIPFFPINVGNNFAQYDVNGCCGVTPGQGNHAVHADGMDVIGGKWVFDMENTWGLWGPFKTGRAYLKEAAIADATQNGDAYIIFDVTEDPQDPNNPPAPV